MHVTLSPRANAMRGALLNLGAQEHGDALRVGELDVLIIGDCVSIPQTASAPLLATRIANLASVFRIDVSLNGGPAIVPPQPLPAASKKRQASNSPPTIAKRIRATLIDSLLEHVPNLERTSPTTARIGGGEFATAITERENIVTVTFESLPKVSARALLGLILVRINAHLDSRHAWLCTIFPEEPPTWLDRTLRNVDLKSEGNKRAYLRAPRSR